jgi:adenylate kinase family enzyme
MQRVLIFGNSGSGKSTLSKKMAHENGLAHLDLDTLAWLPTEPPQRAPLNESKAAIDEFMANNPGWVIEGCYTDLLELASVDAEEIIFLNLDIEQCVENARKRPWEPHKYATKEAQDKNLEMLIGWIRQYTERTDKFSLAAHLNFYEQFPGKKTMRRENL